MQKEKEEKKTRYVYIKNYHKLKNILPIGGNSKYRDHADILVELQRLINSDGIKDEYLVGYRSAPLFEKGYVRLLFKKEDDIGVYYEFNAVQKLPTSVNNEASKT